MKRFCVIILLFLLFCIYPEALFYYGCEGYDVRQLQQGLYRAGYYDGVWDGKYSAEVCEAVKEYQRYNNVFPDGICTYSIARALGVQTEYDKKDEDAVKIARLLCKVCKDSDYLTKLSVASVAVNRLDSPLFPDDIISVIDTLGGAFPCEILQDCMRASYEALRGAKPYGDILYYEKTEHTVKGVKGVRHGGFIFYK